MVLCDKFPSFKAQSHIAQHHARWMFELLCTLKLAMLNACFVRDIEIILCLALLYSSGSQTFFAMEPFEVIDKITKPLFKLILNTMK